MIIECPEREKSTKKKAQKETKHKNEGLLRGTERQRGETQSLIYQFNESGNDRNNCGAASPLKSIAWRFMVH